MYRSSSSTSPSASSSHARLYSAVTGGTVRRLRLGWTPWLTCHTPPASPPPASPRRAADKPACYAFQLDPLDSFESLILTLTALAASRYQRHHPALPRGEDASVTVFVSPKPSLRDSTGVSRLVPTVNPGEPDERVLEFDTTSCTLNPTARLVASIHRPPGAVSSSHDYLSRPPTLDAVRESGEQRAGVIDVSLRNVSVNAARLLATLERLEHDVLANQARSRLQLSRFAEDCGGRDGMRVAAGQRRQTPAWGTYDFTQPQQPLLSRG